jgi:hypothetical protein
VFFDVKHEFDMSLDALELAVLSPDLHEHLRMALAGHITLEQKEHTLSAGTLRRTWNFRADHVLPTRVARLMRIRPRDHWIFEETSVYDLAEHRREWTVAFRLSEWLDRRTQFNGSYQLYPLGRGRTRRVVSGKADIDVPGVGAVLESYLLRLLRRVYDVEALTLREMINLL